MIHDEKDLDEYVIENPENIYQKLENESDKILTKIREFDGSDKNIDDIKNDMDISKLMNKYNSK